MKIGYYGHAHNFIIGYDVGGIYTQQPVYGGIRTICQIIESRTTTEGDAATYNTGILDINEVLYRRTYVEMSRYNREDGEHYYAVSRILGHKEGTTPNNIFSDIPDKPDVLFVFDEGYGGLDLPNVDCPVLWASEKTVPEAEQLSKVANNCLLFLSANALRSSGAMISRQISWERTTTELIREIQTNTAIKHLLSARAIIVAFEFDGAVLITNINNELKASLILTHGGSEGHIKEKRFGTSDHAFTIVVSMMLISPEPFIDILKNNKTSDDIIKQGCAGVRALLELGENIVLTGFQVKDGESDMNISVTNAGRNWDAFSIPLKEVGGLITVPDDWIITDNVGNKRLEDVAFDYVQQGSAIIEGLPQLSFGNLTTIDRWEIESYQNIRNLILGYASGDSVRPLSIAVFGSPGSGKSFGVTEIAKNILPGRVHKLEFNVSQFTDLSDLVAAFQRVRDVVLEGKLPLVFFDEFDSDKDGVALGWVKSFLMPMQDGRFRDGNSEHPIGKCILVFAGGTSANFEEFASPSDADVFKNVKGPDFLSRLRGTISILGPNPRSENDKNYILRRALLLRSLCARKLKSPDAVSPSIIKAMLNVPKFHHGARSMEAILDMSRIENGVWEPAALPFHSQLTLHVDADAFIKLVSEV
ncbi:MAG: hypothetical protein FWE21_05550 [Defluviitaleaceae bacterium]|nr:hypothetical protein [Defluviitaleaceae bacterium]